MKSERPELDYDWDKLRFLLRKFHHVRPRVKAELQQFDAFLAELLSALNVER